MTGSPRPLLAAVGGLAALALIAPTGAASAAEDSATAAQAEGLVAAKATTKPGGTQKTKNLNNLLKSGNKGVLLRSLPDDAGTDLLVASWTRNDIKAPNAMYVSADPNCGPRVTDNQAYLPGPTPGSDPIAWPGGGNTFYSDLCDKNRQQRTGVPDGANSFDYANVGLVSKKVNKLPVGTFYPTDANALDGRAAYTGQDQPDGTPIYNYVSFDAEDNIVPGTGTQDYLGRGCHQQDDNRINQTDSKNPATGETLLQNYECECNTGLSAQNWRQWIDQWLTYAQDSSDNAPVWFNGNDPNVPFGELGGVVGKAPMFALDYVSCWVDNKDEVVALQNGLYFSRAEWWNGLIPLASEDDFNQGPFNKGVQELYWGWNEVLVKKAIDNPSKWAASLIKLPAGKKNLTDLSSAAITKIKKDLKQNFNDFGIPLGNKKKSAVVVLIEKQKGQQEYKRKFKCQGFKFSKNLRINFQKKTKKQKGYCYLSKRK